MSHPRLRGAASPASLLVAALAAAALPAALTAQAAAPLYTAAQAEAGKQIFETACASCHASDLTGLGDAPPLVGPYFASSWGGQKVSTLLDFVEGNMPYTAPGSLDQESYLRVVAYVLARNGVPAGETPLAKGDAGAIALARD